MRIYLLLFMFLSSCVRLDDLKKGGLNDLLVGRLVAAYKGIGTFNFQYPSENFIATVGNPLPAGYLVPVISKNTNNLKPIFEINPPLPDGLSFDQLNGEISGIPLVAIGRKEFRVSAKELNFMYVTKSLIISIYTSYTYNYSGPASHLQIINQNETGLYWLRCTIGTTAACLGNSQPFNWEGAITQCNNLTLQGLEGKNWRLPRLDELYTLYLDNSNPYIDSVVFPNTSNIYWTSSIYKNNQNSVWTINFSTSEISERIKSNSGYVRCISSE